MPLTMTTRNAGRQTAAPRGGKTGGRLVEEVEELATKQLQDLLPTIVAQVGDHIGNQGINESQNDNSADDSIYEDVRNVNVGNG
ncbi:hypothetical protein Tco_0650624 [Tanacetum coccineum]